MIERLGQYPYSSYLAFSNKVEVIPCLKDSFVFEEFSNMKERLEFLGSTVDERVLEEINKASNLVVTSIKDKKLDSKNLKKYFKDVTNNKERDQKILESYNDGYSQHAIATYLGYTQPYINKIIKKMRVIVIT